MKGGYEVGIYFIRELAERSKRTEYVTLLLDFRNAYNSSKRNLLLQNVTLPNS
eukprot:TRINITY_DN7130_c0_g1_i1.p1 TRINITY_DN7130_c0_g1~~TRINITY_DN7130_c0_g1_i1.p1  ORF type:complete len:53 (-),score=2.50 TRINITY_DN7130_c0_g1_i1:649-807(-)